MPIKQGAHLAAGPAAGGLRGAASAGVQRRCNAGLPCGDPAAILPVAALLLFRCRLAGDVGDVLLNRCRLAGEVGVMHLPGFFAVELFPISAF